MNYTEASRSFQTFSSQYHSRKGQKEMLEKSIQSCSEQLSGLSELIDLEDKTVQLLQSTSAAVWNETKSVVENLVTRALKAIFHDRDYKFIVKQEIKRGQSSTSFYLSENGMELDLEDEVGGGVVDVVSLVLRIALLILYKPAMCRLLILDEPCKMVGRSYASNVSRFLKQLTTELDLTVIMVTHSDILAEEADQIFKASNVDGVCLVEEMTVAS